MIDQLGENAKKASFESASLDTDIKNAVLVGVGESLLKYEHRILDANQRDVNHAKLKNVAAPLIDRLLLNHQRIQSIRDALVEISHLEDPVGRMLEHRVLDNGLSIDKVSVPLGVIGIIYESRPNVTVDAFALCFKSGNACILKGGKEAINTNKALVSIIQDVCKDYHVNPYMIQLLETTDRESTNKMMTMRDYIDVLIPRGSAKLIQAVVENATIPVIETGSGNCHIYIDDVYDKDQALKIIRNAKLQRLGVCNAAESLVVHAKQAQDIIPEIVTSMPEVIFYGDARSVALDSRIVPATPYDYDAEYLSAKLSIVVVDTLDDAIQHINKHNTKHSESIITANMEHAEQFLNQVDAAAVYVNASTRFTDGSEMGLGAEIGISTQKLHARGPMGLRELTSYKYKIRGTGQIR